METDPFLKDKNITLCVTGSIAAYKAVFLASFLKKKGANVHVILSKNGEKFVTPITFKTITRNPVITELFDKSGFIPHISIAELSDIILVAPATANIIAKAAHGICDDMISTVLLSSKAVKLIIPVMNTLMYENSITQHNLKILKENGFQIMNPAFGEMACGTTGKGRFPEIESIYGFLIQVLAKIKKGKFSEKKILVTAGGTTEDIDPVRYISNRSSGKTAFSFAEQFLRQGAHIKIIVGNVSERVMDNFASQFGHANLIKVRTAFEMKKKVTECFPESDILFMCAAVADYKPDYQTSKIKKAEEKLLLTLSKTEDVLGSIAPYKMKKILIGFAAETEQIEEYAKKKLSQKKLDFVIANSVAGEKSAFGGDHSELLLFSRFSSTHTLFPYAEKSENAKKVVDKIADILKENNNLL